MRSHCFRIPRVASLLGVLWQLLFSSFSVAQQDSSITFEPTGRAGSQTPKAAKTLEGILSGSIGPYNGFTQGEFKTFLQPAVGFEFLARPGGWLSLLIGGKLGFSDPMTSSIHVGVRQPFYEEKDRSAMIFGDAAVLFFDDADRVAPIGVGARGVIGGRTDWFTTFEYRLAGEYRGRGGLELDGSDARPLWWVGAEIGLAFTLGSAVEPVTRKDSIRSAIQHIAQSNELKEFDELRSNSSIEYWLDQFWKRRDLTPTTEVNEARIEYERRVRLANERFSRPRKLGIDTDAGRVLALYNDPDVTESGSSSFDATYRYELWVYRSRIKHIPVALFLFAVSEPREWRQVYSNVPGEPTGPIPGDVPQRMRSWF